MNRSDKDFDRLFREASERFEPDDSMLSWNKLEKNLAGQLPERPPGRPKRFGLRPMVWVPAAVLFAGLSFFLIKNHQPYRSLSTLPSSTLTNSVSPAPAAGASPALPPAAADRKNAAATEDKKTANNTAANNTAANNTAANNTAANHKPVSGKPVAGNGAAAGSPAASTDGKPPGNPVPAGSGENTLRGTRKSDHSKTNPELTSLRPAAISPASHPATTNSITALPSSNLTETNNRHLRRHSGLPGYPDEGIATRGKKIRPSKNKESKRNGTNGSAGDNDEAIAGNRTADKSGTGLSRKKSADDRKDISTAANGSAGRPEFASAHLPSAVHGAAPLVADNKAALALQAAQNKKLITPSRSVQVRQPLTLGLVMGPDYTDGGVTSNQLGNSVGISIAYYLTDRLSVNSGLLYGVKSYSAKGKDFQPPPPPLRAFGSYPHFESANGTVTLFEIPLSLRYDFPVDSKTRLFVNAGLSSYLPLKETFTTYFHDQGRIYGLRTVNDNPEAHWFAIGHFSGGIERDLGKGLSFQVEPYFNLPFTNVCTGNVKLNTYGVLISIRFSPVISRKKG